MVFTLSLQSRESQLNLRLPEGCRGQSCWGFVEYQGSSDWKIPASEILRVYRRCCRLAESNDLQTLSNNAWYHEAIAAAFECPFLQTPCPVAILWRFPRFVLLTDLFLQDCTWAALVEGGRVSGYVLTLRASQSDPRVSSACAGSSIACSLICPWHLCPA